MRYFIFFAVALKIIHLSVYTEQRLERGFPGRATPLPLLVIAIIRGHDLLPCERLIELNACTCCARPALDSEKNISHSSLDMYNSVPGVGDDLISLCNNENILLLKAGISGDEIKHVLFSQNKLIINIITIFSLIIMSKYTLFNIN